MTGLRQKGLSVGGAYEGMGRRANMQIQLARMELVCLFDQLPPGSNQPGKDVDYHGFIKLPDPQVEDPF